MKLKITQIGTRKSLSSTWHVFLFNQADSPYYRVCQDSDNESINFFESIYAEPRTVLQCFSEYPYGAKTISDIICRDMEIQGYDRGEIDNPPWGE